jgi:transposase
MRDSKPKNSIKKAKTSQENIKVSKDLPIVNSHAAGIDIGSRSHYVAAPTKENEIAVREFGSFNTDLDELVTWLKSCGVKTVAMESTGIYWIPLYEKLEENGLEAVLVNASHIKNVPGRKSDVKDCQWIQKLHSHGLLRGAFRPKEDVLKLRSVLRHRQSLIRHQSPHVLHMQKALMCMNVQLHHAVSDILGMTGMRIISAILQGERDSEKLAELRDHRCANDKGTIAKALQGNFKEEQLFILGISLEMYQNYQQCIRDCDVLLEKILSSFDDKITPEDIAKMEKQSLYKSNRSKKNKMDFPVAPLLHQKTGSNIFSIPGFNTTTAITAIAEIGLDVSAWRTSKRFVSWLTLAPRNKISGGKVLSSSTPKNKNKLAQVLKFAASTLYASDTYLGAQFRKLQARLGPESAITALARKLAIILYNMLKYGQEFVELGAEYHEKQHRERAIRNLKKRATALGLDVIPAETVAA